MFLKEAEKHLTLRSLESVVGFGGALHATVCAMLSYCQRWALLCKISSTRVVDVNMYQVRTSVALAFDCTDVAPTTRTTTTGHELQLQPLGLGGPPKKGQTRLLQNNGTCDPCDPKILPS
jgi:hypothetical protein